MITDNLDMELRPFGIKVMLLALGVISSNIATNAEVAHHYKPQISYYDKYRENINARVGLGQEVMPTESFARRTVNAALASSPPSYMSFGGQAIASRLFCLLPRQWRLNIGWRAYSQAKPKV
jgi:1-acylglycerone phosphate reductase